MNSIYKYFSLAFLLLLPLAVQGMDSEQPNMPMEKRSRSDTEGNGCSSTTPASTSDNNFFSCLPRELCGKVLEHINGRTGLVSPEEIARLGLVCRSLKNAPYGISLDLANQSKTFITSCSEARVNKLFGTAHDQSRAERERVRYIELDPIHGGSDNLLTTVQRLEQIFPNLALVGIDASLGDINELIAAAETNPRMQETVAKKVRSIKLGFIQGRFDPLFEIIKKLEKTFPTLKSLDIDLSYWTINDIDKLISTAAADAFMQQSIRGICCRLARDVNDVVLQAIIATFPNLESLELPFEFSRLTPRDLDVLARIHGLRKLIIYDPIDGNTLRAIMMANQHLEKVCLCFSEQLSHPRDLDAFAQLHDLQELNIERAPINGDTLRAIVKANQNLATIGLTQCKQLSARDFDVIAQLHNVRELTVACTAIDGDALRAIIAANQHLEVVTLLGCKHITAQDFGAFTQCHNLRYLCGAVTDENIRRAIEAANPGVLVHLLCMK